MTLRDCRIFFFNVFLCLVYSNLESKLFILSGPSGAGKTTIVNDLVNHNIAQFFPTTTTRAMRTGEINGVDYYFISKEEFESRLSDFIQPQQVFENWYGPDQTLLQEKLTMNDQPMLMVVTFNLALVLKTIFPDQVVTIFITPLVQNAEQILTQRMHARGESKESIMKRLKNLQQELLQMHQADYVIVNDNLQQACNEMRNILMSNC